MLNPNYDTLTPNLSYLLRLNFLFYSRPLLAKDIYQLYPTESDFLEYFDRLLPIAVSSDSAKDFLKKRNDLFSFDSILNRCRELDIGLLTQESDYYPVSLKVLPDAPLLLFYKGHLTFLLDPLLAVVGPRKMSPYGQKVTEHFCNTLALYFTLVSGLAKGVDTIAHTVGLQTRSGTIAVVGSGINISYPAENKSLSDRICKEGLLLSEFPLDMGPRTYHFPQRNRLVSGLSRAVLVTEASKNSGSLITAQLALEQNKDVFAIPGSIFESNSSGVHALIKEGALCCHSVSDLLTAYPELLTKPTLSQLTFPLETVSASVTEDPLPLSLEERLLFDALQTPTSVDALILKTKLPIQSILHHLTFMELSGYIKQTATQEYAREDIYDGR